MHVDLDTFKKVNDAVEHAEGDAVLKHAAKTMALSMEHSDFLARVGGDVFALVLLGAHTEEGLGNRAEQTIERISTPFLFDSKGNRIGASIGIAIKEETDRISLAKCMNNADLALYHAKNARPAVFSRLTCARKVIRTKSFSQRSARR